MNSNLSSASSFTEAPSLAEWRLPNSDAAFDDEKYLDGLEDFAKDANEVFEKVLEGIAE